MNRRVLSALTPDLALAIERDVLRRDDIHLVAVRSIDELIAAAREGAALCLLEPLLPDGDAGDALEALRALDTATPLPVVLITPRDAPRARSLDEGFAAVIELPDPEGALAEVIGRLLGAPRRSGARRFAPARVLDDMGAPLGRVVDLSPGGLAVRTRRALSIGEALAFSIELVAQGLVLPARGVVVRFEAEVAALRLEAPSEALSRALAEALAMRPPASGFSFAPLPERGPRAAAIGGAVAEGPALTALTALVLEGDPAAPFQLLLHALAPFDEVGLDRWIELIGRLAAAELHGCPTWFTGLAARLPAVTGRPGQKATLRSMQVALRCTSCGDELEDAARWTTPAEARDALDACALRPCYVCGGVLALEEPVEALASALAR